jgi:FkbM family methyltransferase
MHIKRFAKEQFPVFGIDVVRFTPQHHSLARRKALFDTYGISLVIDVGAHTGLYVKELRRLGYSGRVISYEPLSASYLTLQKKAQRDPFWDTYNCALGEATGQAKINISRNSYSSSLLEMMPSHVGAAPGSEYAGQELVDIVTLDSVFDSVRKPSDHTYLKIDTQGYEDRVLNGAEKALYDIDTIQLEMSIVPLYDAALLFDEMNRRLSQLGYRLVGIETGFTDDTTGELLQFDGIYHRYE